MKAEHAKLKNESDEERGRHMDYEDRLKRGHDHSLDLIGTDVALTLKEVKANIKKLEAL